MKTEDVTKIETYYSNELNDKVLNKIKQELELEVEVELGRVKHESTSIATISKKHSEVLQFSCYICDKRFKTTKALQKHDDIHLKLNPYKCKLCKINFASTGELSRHRRYIHTRNNHINAMNVTTPVLKQKSLFDI